jgi:hypothetical protein
MIRDDDNGNCSIGMWLQNLQAAVQNERDDDHSYEIYNYYLRWINAANLSRTVE